MGPHSFKCGSTVEYKDPGASSSMLQWGRTLSSAEVLTNPGAECVQLNASMGPHSFKCGSIACVNHCY